MTDVGMFDKIIGALMKKVGHNVVGVTLMTSIIAMIAHLDGAGAVDNVEIEAAGNTETREYALTQTSTEEDNGVNVKISGWVSTDSLDGQEWEIYIQADGKLYNTNYKLAL